MQDELEALTRVLELPTRPLAAIVGGAKVSTKLDLLGNLLAKVDVLVIGGGMANTFTGRARARPSANRCASMTLLPTAREIMAIAKAKGREIVCRSTPWSPRRSKPTPPSRVTRPSSAWRPTR